ncbi:nitrogenase component 1 [Rubrobacter indicoceani]|uniref:nitrogenase component 1 n=1 Tax=Rubrobacter indicoceani TaxID=2051957 RepID=UPI0013C3E86E|nr:nitrogenase component 1 [Rubrobacter indicoceani]
MRVLRGLYEGPGSHGVLRVASSMEKVHAVLRAMPGEGYFPALQQRIEQAGKPSSVTLSPVWKRPEDTNSPGDPGRDLASVVRNHPEAEAVVLTRSEATLLLGEPPPEPGPQRNPLTGRETKVVACNWETADILETEAAELVLEDLVRAHAVATGRSEKPSVNLFGPLIFGPGVRAEYDEAERLMGLLGLEVNARVPLDAEPGDLARLTRAWVNVLLYREVGESATLYLQDAFQMPRVTTPMIGTSGTGAALKTVGRLCELDHDAVRRTLWAELSRTARLPWYARLAPPELFEGRRAFIFGDFTYSLGLGHTLSREVGLEVPYCGTYMAHLGRDFKFHAETFAEEAFVTDDPEEVAERIERNGPDLVIGTHLERDVADSLDIPFLPLCPPVAEHPFIERPMLGYSGSGVLADMLEAALGRREERPGPKRPSLAWTEEAMEELEEVPAFLRGRARRLAEEHAREDGSPEVTREIFLASRP